MSNYIFIPDNNSLIALEGLRKGTICYKINTSPYQTISWTVRQTLFYKIQYKMKKSSGQLIFDENMLSSDEKTEFKRLFNNFNNLNKVPREKVIKNCIIVFAHRKGAIGFKIIGVNIYVSFKSSKLNEIKEICKRNNVTINYDNKLASYLFANCYLNEIPELNICRLLAERFIKIIKRNKVFDNKLKLILAGDC